MRMKAFFGFHIGLTMVSGTSPLPPRGFLLERLAGPSMRHCLLEWLGSCTGMPAVWGLALSLEPVCEAVKGAAWWSSVWAAE